MLLQRTTSDRRTSKERIHQVDIRGRKDREEEKINVQETHLKLLNNRNQFACLTRDSTPCPVSRQSNATPMMCRRHIRRTRMQSIDSTRIDSRWRAGFLGHDTGRLLPVRMEAEKSQGFWWIGRVSWKLRSASRRFVSGTRSRARVGLASTS